MKVWTPAGPRKVVAKEKWATRCPRCAEHDQKSPTPLGIGWVPFIPPEYDVCDRCVLDEVGLGDEGQHDSCDQLGMGSLLYREEAVLTALRDLRWKLSQATRGQGG